jgi:hypothetical protein
MVERDENGVMLVGRPDALAAPENSTVRVRA